MQGPPQAVGGRMSDREGAVNAAKRLANAAAKLHAQVAECKGLRAADADYFTGAAEALYAAVALLRTRIERDDRG
jgi:hypothetical protein